MRWESDTQMKCKECCGDGYNLRIIKKGNGYTTERVTCEHCNGTGEVQMTELKLKPCPFCGGEAKTGRIFGHETVFCTECDACILPSPYNSFANTDKELDESIKMWNARVVAE